MREDKPGLCYRKFTGCEPADDDDCVGCPPQGDWPEDWDQAVESYREREFGEYE